MPFVAIQYGYMLDADALCAMLALPAESPVPAHREKQPMTKKMVFAVLASAAIACASLAAGPAFAAKKRLWHKTYHCHPGLYDDTCHKHWHWHYGENHHPTIN
jgi:hypothetical protein